MPPEHAERCLRPRRWCLRRRFAAITNVFLAFSSGHARSPVGFVWDSGPFRESFLWICMISGTDVLGVRTASAMFVMMLGHLRDRFPEEFLESCAAVLRPRSASGACETGSRTSPFVLAAVFCCNYQRFPCVFDWSCTVPGRVCLGSRTVPGISFCKSV